MPDDSEDGHGNDYIPSPSIGHETFDIDIRKDSQSESIKKHEPRPSSSPSSMGSAPPYPTSLQDLLIPDEPKAGSESVFDFLNASESSTSSDSETHRIRRNRHKAQDEGGSGPPRRPAPRTYIEDKVGEAPAHRKDHALKITDRLTMTANARASRFGERSKIPRTKNALMKAKVSPKILKNYTPNSWTLHSR